MGSETSRNRSLIIRGGYWGYLKADAVLRTGKLLELIHKGASVI